MRILSITGICHTRILSAQKPFAREAMNAISALSAIRRMQGMDGNAVKAYNGTG